MLAPLMLELAKVAQKSRSQVNTALEGLGAAWLSELVKEVAPVAGTSTTTDYASYQGSLTRPGCQEGVTWIIFLTPLKISSTQMEVFRSASLWININVDLNILLPRTLKDGEHTVHPNFRDTQSLQDRQVTLYKAREQ